MYADIQYEVEDPVATIRLDRPEKLNAFTMPMLGELRHAGVAAGGGFVMASMCDLRFASTDASFTTLFTKRDLIAEHGTTWILPRLLGAGRALDLLWSSRLVERREPKFPRLGSRLP